MTNLNQPVENITSIILILFVYKKDFIRKKKNARSFRELQSEKCENGKRGKSIHVIIRQSDTENPRDPSNMLSEIKQTICGSGLQRYELSVSKFHNLTNRDSWKLEIECRRCTKRVSIILPQKHQTCRTMMRQRRQRRRGSKTKRRAGRRRRHRSHKSKSHKSKSHKSKSHKSKSPKSKNPKPKSHKPKSNKKRFFKNCVPITLLTEKKTDKDFLPKLVIFSNTESSSKRPKRAASPISTDDRVPPALVSQSHASSENSTSCCQMIETCIDFNDLDLGEKIVKPSGFNFRTCSTVYPGDFQTWHRIQATTRLRIQREFREAHSMSVRNDRPLNLTSVLYNISRIPNRSRLKENLSSDKVCLPTKREKLQVLHFDENSILQESVIPEFFESNCMCNSS